MQGVLLEIADCGRRTQQCGNRRGMAHENFKPRFFLGVLRNRASTDLGWPTTIGTFASELRAAIGPSEGHSIISESANFPNDYPLAPATFFPVCVSNRSAHPVEQKKY